MGRELKDHTKMTVLNPDANSDNMSDVPNIPYKVSLAC